MEELKTWPDSFQAIWDGIKTYEVRIADRPFKLWSVVHLREYDPVKKKYTGREIAANITYITRPNWLQAMYGVESKFCVFGIRVYQKIDRNDPNSKAAKV